MKKRKSKKNSNKGAGERQVRSWLTYAVRPEGVHEVEVDGAGQGAVHILQGAVHSWRGRAGNEWVRWIKVTS